MAHPSRGRGRGTQGPRGWRGAPEQTRAGAARAMVEVEVVVRHAWWSLVGVPRVAQGKQRPAPDANAGCWGKSHPSLGARRCSPLPLPGPAPHLPPDINPGFSLSLLFTCRIFQSLFNSFNSLLLPCAILSIYST